MQYAKANNNVCCADARFGLFIFIQFSLFLFVLLQHFFHSCWPTADAVNLARLGYRRDWIVDWAALVCALLFEFALTRGGRRNWLALPWLPSVADEAHVYIECLTRVWVSVSVQLSSVCVCVCVRVHVSIVDCKFWWQRFVCIFLHFARLLFVLLHLPTRVSLSALVYLSNWLCCPWEHP